MSLLPECQQWSRWAIGALGETDRDSAREMRLQAAAGISLMFMRGGLTGALEALETSLVIAERIDDVAFQAKLLGPLNMFYLRTGQFQSAHRCAERCRIMIEALDDPAFTAMAHCILGTSLHLRGELASAREELAMSRAISSARIRSTADHLGFESRSLAGGILARCLWLGGETAEATALAHQIVREAEDLDHPLSLSIALIWAVTAFLWNEDLHVAGNGTSTSWLPAPKPMASNPTPSVARGLGGELAIRRGDAATGVLLLQECLQALHVAPYKLLTTSLSIALAEGLTNLARADEAMAVVDEALRSSAINGDWCYRPELLRIKSRITRTLQPDNSSEAHAPSGERGFGKSAPGCTLLGATCRRRSRQNARLRSEGVQAVSSDL